jgi:plastocyanin
MPDGNWNSGQHSPPFTFMHTFSTSNPSGYNYYCSVHLAMMQGVVVVN